MIKQSKTICVIPARRGSKRLPLKNIKKLAGKPLISYAITAAVRTGLFEKVYVATEDREIAEAAGKYGAAVFTLVPKNLCGDRNPSWEPCLWLTDGLAVAQSKKFENLLVLQPTSPLITPSDIKKALQVFEKERRDFLVSVTPVDPHFFHWAVIKDKSGKWKMFFGKKFMKERLDLPPVFRPNGAVKIAKIEKLRRQKNFFGKNLGVSFMPEERSLHVISQTDIELAESLMKIK